MIKYIFTFLFLMYAFTGNAQKTGDQIFNSTCKACHSIGGGKIVGPDLDGVANKYDLPWLIKFIRSSQTLVKSGDARAVKTFNANGKIPMPDQNLSDAEIKNVINYIKSKSKASSPKPVGKPNTGKGTSTVTPKPATSWVESQSKIKVVKTNEKIDIMNMNQSLWNNVPSTQISFAPQQVVYPNLANATITSADVQCLYTGKQLIFKTTWADPTRDVYVDFDKFCDQFAVQLPVDTADIPSYMMGNRGGKVHIVHWKGIWQEDCENGFRDVQDAYPNMWVDVYTFQESELDRSKRIYSKDLTAEQIVESQKTNNMPGTYSKNPISQIKRKTPVEEATAVGYGTLTTQETQQASGWAKWENGKWTLIIVVPVNTGNIYKARFGKRTKVAFALWNGGDQNIGGRKHFAQWSDLILE